MTQHRDYTPRLAAIAAVLVGLGIATLGGCDIPPRPPLGQVEESMGIDEEALAALAEPPAVDIGLEEGWASCDVFFRAGRPVGIAEVVAQVDPDGTLRYNMDSVLEIPLAAASVLEQVQQQVTCSSTGEVQAYNFSRRFGNIASEQSAVVDDNFVQLEVTRAGRTIKRSFDIESGVGGFAAIEQAIRNQPLTERGETVGLKMVLPRLNGVATVQMRCGGEAIVPLLDQSMSKLNEINIDVTLPNGSHQYLTYWVDENNAIARTFVDGSGLIGYRTDRETALELLSVPPSVVSIPVEGTIEKPAKTYWAGYRIRIDPAGQTLLDTNGWAQSVMWPGQGVRAFAPERIEVLVSRGRQIPAAFSQQTLEPTPQDRASNRWIDFRSKSIQRLAKAAAKRSEGTSDGEFIVSITQAARTLVGELGDETSWLPIGSAGEGLMPASEVASRGGGDSTARAIFLTAMLRARRIPARLALGLKYRSARDGQPARLVEHVWVLAHDGTDWMHVDLDKPEPDREFDDLPTSSAARLLITTSTLSGPSPYDAWIELIDRVRWMNVTIAGTRH